ncbi:uncharacterized protein LACBIDRAFT_335437 [Laccaria bicolor S238N-H82]|uniref:Predicted protein n=1 Tax=Laccaria bicolor (strain S238N-H82 / ATCC MYA-4686) TaxID=486041 RepID=B0E2B9_LACBS|nr:uncharacterized protein LACBIDRAFT_335437 [Laccaria bicolor S238N-H82]EDQ99029.1 predicted protein [Laccaria bicolor S238N-H82]|eukprot:XP_001890337.1 predicted protein [Laccaria bicolor S238N-H82]
MTDQILTQRMLSRRTGQLCKCNKRFPGTRMPPPKLPNLRAGASLIHSFHFATRGNPHHKSGPFAASQSFAALKADASHVYILAKGSLQEKSMPLPSGLEELDTLISATFQFLSSVLAPNDERIYALQTKCLQRTVVSSLPTTLLKNEIGHSRHAKPHTQQDRTHFRKEVPQEQIKADASCCGRCMGLCLLCLGQANGGTPLMHRSVAGSMIVWGGVGAGYRCQSMKGARCWLSWGLFMHFWVFPRDWAYSCSYGQDFYISVAMASAFSWFKPQPS